MTGKHIVNKSGKQGSTPLGIMVAAADGGLATVPCRPDAHGWVARLNGTTYYLSAVVTGGTE